MPVLFNICDKVGQPLFVFRYADFYLRQIGRNRNYLCDHGIIHIATDGLYSRTRFTDGITEPGFRQIGRLRGDANLRYLYKGPRKKGRGRKKQSDGKVIFNEFSRWEFVTEYEPGVLLRTAVLNSPRFRRNLRVVCLPDQRKPEKHRYALFFSTDLTLAASDIFNMYRSRFRIEFIFRDARQFTGLTDCQARSREAPNFHFNASLTALSLLKKQDREAEEKADSEVCSVASWKTRFFNEHLPDRFISNPGLNPEFIKKYSSIR